MKFSEAFEKMKSGAKVKLPSWGGYWCWDAEKETIMMHCRPQDADKPGDVLDIREMQRVEYTLKNILSDDGCKGMRFQPDCQTYHLIFLTLF